MITTIDEVVCNNGDKVWVLGHDKKGNYTPKIEIVNNSTPINKKCWHSYIICRIQCDRQNRAKKKLE